MELSPTVKYFYATGEGVQVESIEGILFYKEKPFRLGNSHLPTKADKPIFFLLWKIVCLAFF